MTSLVKTILRPIGRFGWEGTARMVAGRALRKLGAEMRGEATDLFVHALLHGMDLSFMIFPALQRKVKGLTASYVFAAGGKHVCGAAMFENGSMRVHGNLAEKPTVLVTFTDHSALRRFLFSRDHDILESLLENDVTVEGNLNYLYRFGYVAREVMDRVGLAAEDGSG